MDYKIILIVQTSKRKLKFSLSVGLFLIIKKLKTHEEIIFVNQNSI